MWASGIMGLPGLTKPAGDASRRAERRRSPEPSRLQPIPLLATAALASALLLGLGNLLKSVIRPGRGRPSSKKLERLPTHVLVNSKGVEVHISPVGAAIERLNIPDRAGRLTDVVLGFDKKTPYADGSNPYFGIVVGRCANRIANATFAIDRKQYNLTANDGQHALHGGAHGWGEKVWNAEKTTFEGAPAVRLTYTSKDGEEGYPGNVKATVTYVLTDGGTAKQNRGYLRAIMEATTDKATPVNLAQHSYWNLAGHDSGDILDHNLTIYADLYTPVDDTRIPTGKLEPVKGTPFDFSKSRKIGARISEVPGGYDHNFVLKPSDSKADPRLKQAAVLQDPGSGRSVEVATTAPGLQFYSGNFLDGSVVGKGGTAYAKYAGVALESQAFPDSINQRQFPSVLLRPGERYYHEVAYLLRSSK